MNETLSYLPIVLVSVGAIAVVAVAIHSLTRTPPRAVVFLSSTSEFKDLHPKMELWIRGLGPYDPWSYLNNDATEEQIEKIISESQVFVLILGRTFGSMWGESGSSIVQRELELALGHVPDYGIRPFLKSPPGGPVEERQQAFVASIREYGSKFQCPEWGQESELHIGVAEGLSRARERRIGDREQRHKKVGLGLALATAAFGALALARAVGWGPDLASPLMASGAFGVVALTAAGYNVFHKVSE